MEEISAAWRRIVQRFEIHAPSWLDLGGPHPLFRPPAPEEELARLEARMRLALPEQLRALLESHDGCRANRYPLNMRATRPTNWRTMPTAEVADQWEMLSAIAAGTPLPSTIQTVGPVQPVWWSAQWIPVFECGMGDVICVDAAPAVSGHAGQLILYEHDFEERKVLYPSILDWLREYAADLERGEYVYIDGLGVHHKDDRFDG